MHHTICSQMLLGRTHSIFPGLDSPLFATIVLFKTQAFSRDSGGFLERRIPRKNGWKVPLGLFGPHFGRGLRSGSGGTSRSQASRASSSWILTGRQGVGVGSVAVGWRVAQLLVLVPEFMEFLSLLGFGPLK